MTQNLVSLAPEELALWLGLSAEAAQEKVRVRTEEGRWRLVAGANPEDPERIELPAVDLNAEIDARHDPTPAAEATANDPEARVAMLEAELVQARQRNEELHDLLQQAARAIQQTEPQRAELKAEKAKAGQLSDDLLETKGALVAAFDKILNLQQKLVAAQSKIAAAREDAATLDGISTILDRLKSRRG